MRRAVEDLDASQQSVTTSIVPAHGIGIDSLISRTGHGRD